MGKLENILLKFNQYLRSKGLPLIDKEVKDIYTLYEAALRSVWGIEEKNVREGIVVEISQALKPYFGGKRIEDALDEITKKLDKEQQAKTLESRKDAEKKRLDDLKKKMENPDYVPTFEELMKMKTDKGKQ